MTGNSMSKFIGRKKELEKLRDIAKKGSNLVVIRGRRRVGKSHLVKEHGKSVRFLEFSGLAPDKDMTAQDQRDHFANQLVHQLKMAPCTFKDWYDAFVGLAQYLDTGPTVIFFDEISWMAQDDPTFIPKLKDWWDRIVHQYPRIQLILCGSVSLWIEENIIKSTALFGRISLVIHLEEWSLLESLEYLKAVGFKGSDQDFFRLLSVTGGIPWYLAQINTDFLLEDNIKRLCFGKNGLFVQEFDRIFNDLYQGDSPIYKKIIYALEGGMKTLEGLRQALGYDHGGFLNRYIENLCLSGFVTKHRLWSFKTGKSGKQSLYRLSDHYLRFYVKYIEPNLEKINKGDFEHSPSIAIPNWQGILGIQLENLLLNNRPLLLAKLGVGFDSIVADNPYLQKGTKKIEGCQIDYLIQTKLQTLLVCEFKLNKRTIGVEVIDEMQEKLRRLSIPRGFGKVPVLVHMGDLSDDLLERGYFYRTIDLRDWLHPPC
jgi:AAA+ ATPase superfamily predicted ATPase